MFPALRKKFLIITPSLASAFPQQTSTITAAPTSSSLALPSSLQALVPQCAQSCLESVLFDEWPLGCSSAGDLECLCSEYGTTGLTLGEAAYGCAVTSCPSSTPNLASTYRICAGQDGAVVATHSTLTFTHHITSTQDSSTRSAASATSIGSSAIGTNTTSTQNSSTSSTSSRTSSRTSLITSTSTSPSPSAAASTTSPQPAASSTAAAAAAGSSSGGSNGSLSTAQIIGISVASVSAVVLAVGVLFLLACLRKRDRKKEEESSEKQGKNPFALTPPSHDNVVMSPTALEQFPSPPRNRRDPRNGGGVGIAVPQVRVDAASPPRPRAPTPLESIGLAITEDTPMASPASIASSRTVSQLLPDKPEPARARQPAPVPTSPVPRGAPFIAKKKKRDSSMTQDTVFEEDTAVRKSMHPVRAVQVPPRQQPPPILPPVRPYRPPPSFAQEYTASPKTTQQPPLSLMIPPQGRQYPRQPTPSPPPIPSPLRIARPPKAGPPPPLPPQSVRMVPPDPHSSASSGSTKFTGTNSTASSSYIPAYYTSPPTSIMQTPPESYGHGTGAAFSGPPQSRSPPRQAQTSAPPAHVQTGLPPQPSPAHHPQQVQAQRAQANHPPAALRQPYPPPPTGQPASHPGLPAAAAAAAKPAPQGQPTYTPYSVAMANAYAKYPYPRPPLPPQPQSPPRAAAQQRARRPHPPVPQRSTSSASMTSFESASPDDLDDQTPPEDSATAAKQLGGDTAVDRHPHAISTSPSLAAAANAAGDPSDRSPISDIKYPKVPRASNQAVPRTSPNTSARVGTPSPRIAQQGGQPSPPPSGTSSPAQATLLARRRGDAGGLLIDSGASTPAGGASKQATPSSSSKGAAPRTPEGQKAQDTEQARKSSAALPVEERWRQGGGEGDVAIKTPLWVPRLTPTRRGDDLYLAVAYASREGIN